MVWTKIESEVKETEVKVTSFTRDQDYYFRVRAGNEYGVSEPSMPVALRRKESGCFLGWTLFCTSHSHNNWFVLLSLARTNSCRAQKGEEREEGRNS